MKKIISFIILILSILSLTSCGGGELGNSNKKTFTRYYDHSEIVDGDFELKLSVRESGYSNNHSISMILDVVSHKIEKVQFPYGNVELVRSSNGAKYDVSNSIFNPNNEPENVELSCDIHKQISYHAELPTDLKSDKYIFKINSISNYVYNLFETPINERENIKVSFFVNRSPVKTIEIKEGTTTQPFIWLNSSETEFCKEWYEEENCINKFDFSQPITVNTSIYGNRKDCIEYLSFSSDTYTYLSKINLAPKNGILVVPSEVMNKKVCISNFAIQNNNDIHTIYFPKDLVKIYAGNFTGMAKLRTIKYGGSEEEWNKLMSNSSSKVPNNVKILFNQH